MRHTLRPYGNLDHTILCDFKSGKWIKVIKGSKTLRQLYEENINYQMSNPNTKDRITSTQRTMLKTDSQRKKTILER